MRPSALESVDVAIVGGGLIGASLAVALARSKQRVVLIEAQPRLATPAKWDERCIALNDTSKRILELLGVWTALQPQAEPLTATHISEQGRFGTAHFDAAEVGLAALGYNTPLRALGAALADVLVDSLAGAAVQLLQPARLLGLAQSDDHVELRIDEGRVERRIEARLVAAADGADSSVRALLGIGARVRDYRQHAIVTAVHATRPHGGVAYERFTPDGPLALVPKPAEDAAVYSVIRTIASGQVDALMKADDGEFLGMIERELGKRTGPLQDLGARVAYPLRRVIGRRLLQGRVVFVGNAAQTLHPVAAQGFNLGLRDVAGLADLIGNSADPGESALLRRFVASRKSDRAKVSGLTDLMVRVFSNRIPVLAQARQLGLIAIDRIPPLRRQVIDQHLGRLGLPPSLRDSA